MNNRGNKTQIGFTLWFTGLSGAGKSTIATILERKFKELGLKVEILDGDVVRTHLSKGLGFSKEDRDANIRRIGYVASLLARNGVIAITAAISPYRNIRDEAREMNDNFVELLVDMSMPVTLLLPLREKIRPSYCEYVLIFAHMVNVACVSVLLNPGAVI